MGLFSKMVDVLKSNVNDAVDKAEDPAKMLKLMVVEMEEAITKATSSLAQAMGNEKNLARQEAAERAKVAEWQEKAGVALKAGKEDLARKALAQKVASTQSADQFAEMNAQASETTDKIRGQLDQLKGKLAEARAKEQMLVARAKAAEAQKEMAEQVGGIGSSSAFAKFEKMEAKIERMESEAEASMEISEEGLSEDEFAALEKNNDIDDELAKLKAELGA